MNEEIRTRLTEEANYTLVYENTYGGVPPRSLRILTEDIPYLLSRIEELEAENARLRTANESKLR